MFGELEHMWYARIKELAAFSKLFLIDRNPDVAHTLSKTGYFVLIHDSDVRTVLKSP